MKMAFMIIDLIQVRVIQLDH